MAKSKRTLSFKNAEILFENEGLAILEINKEEEIRTELNDVLRMFEGCKNLTISFATEAEI